jgi:bifunctional non-homologous end joining protein LigD
LAEQRRLRDHRRRDRSPATDGTTNFSVLKGTSKIVMVAFDLPYLAGYDMRKLALIERKTHLKS